MSVKIDTDELLALAAISGDLCGLKSPTLGFRYYVTGGIVATLAMCTSVIAILHPDFFISQLISPSVIHTDNLIENTRIRGGFTICMIMLWLMSLSYRKIALSILVCTILWTTAITAIDLYKLFELKVFSATISSTIYLISRPVLFFCLLIMARDLSRFMKETDMYLRNSS